MAKAEEGRGVATDARPAARGVAGGALVAALTLAGLAPGAHAQQAAPTPNQNPYQAAPNAAATAGGPGDQGTNTNAQDQGNGQQQGPAGREWTITPALNDSEQFTDNVRQVAHDREADLITTFSPSIFINGDTPRLQTTINYSPEFIKYAYATDQDQITHNLTGTGTATLVPNLLFVDANASMSSISRAGGLGLNNQTPVPTNLTTQNTTVEFSPNAQFHFGDTGTEVVRYTVAESLFSGNTGAITSNSVTGTPLQPITDATQQDANSTFTTGEAFGRTQFTGTLDYTELSGSSAIENKHYVGDMQAEYQLFDPFFLILEAGYERLSYQISSPLDYVGPRYSFGGRYQPRDDRMVQLTYGKQEGNSDFNGSMNYGLTQLTTLTGSYTDESTTQQQQLFSNLSGLSSLSPGSLSNSSTGIPTAVQNPTQAQTGAVVNPATGLPTSLSNPNLALQNQAIRSKNVSLGVTTQAGERNVWSLVFNRSQNIGSVGGALSQTTTGGILSWNHDMSEKSKTFFSGAYSETQSNAGTTAGAAATNINTQNLTLTAGISYDISDTLSSSATYTLERTTGEVGGKVLQDLITVSLRKSF